MVDLAEAIHHTTERYSASGAVFQQVRFNARSGDKGSPKEEWEFDIPIKQTRTLAGSADPGPMFLCGSKTVLGAIRTEFRKFWETHFAFEAEAPASSIHPVSGHFCRYDTGQERWYHILFFRMEDGSPRNLSYGFLGIAEECGGRRPCRMNRDIAVSDERSLKAYYSTYRDFSYRSNLGKVISPSDEDDADLDCVILFSVFLNSKIRSNSFVSMEVLKRCWGRALETGSRRTDLPWECGDPPGARISTATVSLDLRKSTSLMDQVEDREAFAVWLESLSEICREITHENDGIFDKFTGDGIIAHFADADMEVATSIPSPIVRAFTCGCELIRAVDVHLDALRPRLRFNIAASRPAVGMAFDEAAWSLDRDGRPIVVGKGVVNACRLNSGEAGWIQMAYNMKRHLRDGVSKDVYNRIEGGPVDKHKDLKPELLPECFRVTDADINLGRSRDQLGKIVERISAQVKEDHDDRKLLLAANGR
jgi:class 3 adenylate cyclase